MVSLMLLNECNYADGDIGTISGYPQVDVRELNALTLSWNQVNYSPILISFVCIKHTPMNW